MAAFYAFARVSSPGLPSPRACTDNSPAIKHIAIGVQRSKFVQCIIDPISLTIAKVLLAAGGVGVAVSIKDENNLSIGARVASGLTGAPADKVQSWYDATAYDAAAYAAYHALRDYGSGDVVHSWFDSGVRLEPVAPVVSWFDAGVRLGPAAPIYSWFDSGLRLEASTSISTPINEASTPALALSEAATIAMPEASTRKRVSVRMPTRPSYRDRAQVSKGVVVPATVATFMPAVAPALSWLDYLSLELNEVSNTKATTATTSERSLTPILSWLDSGLRLHTFTALAPAAAPAPSGVRLVPATETAPVLSWFGSGVRLVPATETAPVLSWFDSGVRLVPATETAPVLSWFDSGVRLERADALLASLDTAVRLKLASAIDIEWMLKVEPVEHLEVEATVDSRQAQPVTEETSPQVHLATLAHVSPQVTLGPSIAYVRTGEATPSLWPLKPVVGRWAESARDGARRVAEAAARMVTCMAADISPSRYPAYVPAL